MGPYDPGEGEAMAGIELLGAGGWVGLALAQDLGTTLVLGSLSRHRGHGPRPERPRVGIRAVEPASVVRDPPIGTPSDRKGRSM